MRLAPKGITSRLLLAFFATALPLLIAAGLLLEWQARRALEDELARRVESLAAAVSASIPQESWQMLLSLGPGEEESRTARHMRALLRGVHARTASERIAVWTSDGQIVLDAATRLPIGSTAPRAALLRDELAEARAGRLSSSHLFQAESGRWVKIGLAPIGNADSSGNVAGVLVVEAPSATLAVVAAMRRTLLTVGLLAFGVVVAAAMLISRAATRRIRALVTAAERIGRGDLASSVPPLGQDEIGLLAGALEAMRGDVQARDQQLRAMLGGVAHEIRNPLGGLLLYAQMLAGDGGLNEEQVRKAQRIVDETSRLERVVSEFLAFARPESPQGEAVAMRAALEESAESAAGALRWKGDLRINGPDRAEVWCDPGHLRQVLLNLLQNAMQAAGDRGRVSARYETAVDGILLEVEDSGPGIAAADRERIFEPFFTTRATGAGLGLAIVKRLCELNRIDIAVAEGDLGGARFGLRFRSQVGG